MVQPDSSAPAPESVPIAASTPNVSRDAGGTTQTTAQEIADAGNAADASSRVSLDIPCVDPFKDSGAANNAGGRPPAAQADLDTDGRKDFVLFQGGERFVGIYRVYLSRDGCGQFIGTMKSFDAPRALPTQTNGIRDLRTVSDDCPMLGRNPNAHEGGNGWCETVFQFDGKSYQTSSQKRTTRPASAI